MQSLEIAVKTPKTRYYQPLNIFLSLKTSKSNSLSISLLFSLFRILFQGSALGIPMCLCEHVAALAAANFLDCIRNRILNSRTWPRDLKSFLFDWKCELLPDWRQILRFVTIEYTNFIKHAIQSDLQYHERMLELLNDVCTTLLIFDMTKECSLSCQTAYSLFHGGTM